MSEIPPPFDWSKGLEYTWFSEQGIDQFRRKAEPSLLYEIYQWQLECTTRMLDGQDILCVCAMGGGKSALMYLASFARKGTITLVVCPTNSLESDLVRIVLLAIYNFRDDVMIGLEHEPERNICTGNQCRDFGRRC